MKRSKLRFKKFQIAKLTSSSNILGGNGDTTFTTTGNDDSNTQAPTSQATGTGSIRICTVTLWDTCNCYGNTTDPINGGTTVP